MSGPLIADVERAGDLLSRALDAMDADAIFGASDQLARAVAALRAHGSWGAGSSANGPVAPTGQVAERLDRMARRIGGLRRRVNLMTDQARSHVEGLTLLGVRVPPATYAARR